MQAVRGRNCLLGKDLRERKQIKRNCVPILAAQGVIPSREAFHVSEADVCTRQTGICQSVVIVKTLVFFSHLLNPKVISTVYRILCISRSHLSLYTSHVWSCVNAFVSLPNVINIYNIRHHVLAEVLDTKFLTVAAATLSFTNISH